MIFRGTDRRFQGAEIYPASKPFWARGLNSAGDDRVRRIPQRIEAYAEENRKTNRRYF